VHAPPPTPSQAPLATPRPTTPPPATSKRRRAVVDVAQALAQPSRWRRALLWGALLALLLVAQSLLVVLTVNHEAAKAQEETETAAAQAVAALRREAQGSLQALQSVAIQDTESLSASTAAQALQQHGSLARIEMRDSAMTLRSAFDSPLAKPLFARMPRRDLQVESDWACAAARRASAPMFGRSFFVPSSDGLGQEVIDVCVPVLQAGRETGFVVGVIGLTRLLEAATPVDTANRNELSFVEGDGTRLARSGQARGAAVFVAERTLDLPGTPLRLRADSVRARPSLVPNLATALVVGLSLALFGVVLVLARDVRRRAKAEAALAEALAFRKAMEDSLSTGLRARDLHGVVTYANPAFCAMVGYSAEALAQAHETQPYWPTELLDEYRQRQQQRLTNATSSAAEQAREGFETVFVRQNGERFPVMVYEAPLVDGQGRHTGWMGAVVDLSTQRKVEELSRQQQDRLQATARLATVGEMASLLSHELNQPLAAIASYATGSLNLMADPQPETPALLQQALGRIAEQAERAGRVIKSVHDFVRRREQHHENISVAVVFESVLPLVRLQARKSGARIEVGHVRSDGSLLPLSTSDTRLASASPRFPPTALPSVRCDRTMIEQVLLNLTRNGIQAMEDHTELAQRVLTLQVSGPDPRWVRFAVTDAGPGVPDAVATQLFTPFFTTRAEGMGLGLSLCRTVIEQHGGRLDFGPGPGGVGTTFSFTLPAAKEREKSETRHSASAA
jgi:two-component system, LuxR family, sensor histidine kinase DctS